MRLQENVRRENRGLELGVFADMTWILMGAHVEPGPTVKATWFEVSDVVGNQIVSQAVPFIGGTPEFASCGIDGFTDAVSDARRVNALELPFGGELKDIGALEI